MQPYLGTKAILKKGQHYVYLSHPPPLSSSIPPTGSRLQFTSYGPQQRLETRCWAGEGQRQCLFPENTKRRQPGAISNPPGGGGALPVEVRNNLGKRTDKRAGAHRASPSLVEAKGPGPSGLTRAGQKGECRGTQDQACLLDPSEGRRGFEQIKSPRAVHERR